MRCLFFFDLRILTTPLVSSNFSQKVCNLLLSAPKGQFHVMLRYQTVQKIMNRCCGCFLKSADETAAEVEEHSIVRAILHVYVLGGYSGAAAD